MIKSVSELTGLKKHAPPSIHALRYRAESDIPDFIKVLHAFGYYEASVSMRVEETFKTAVVTVLIRSGPVYKLENYQINLSYHDSRIICDQIQLQNIGLNLGKPAVAEHLLYAEGRLLQLLSEYGYPLAKIEKREVIANGKTKQVTVQLNVDTGPLSRFGPIRYEGQTQVKPQYMGKKVAWCEGEIYNSQLVECSQQSLLDTGLFSSVLITHDNALGENGEMPMRIEVSETKHRSVNIGASYQTFWGFGLGFGWENRNIHGLGRKLSIQGDVTKNSHTGLAAYIVPDFRKPGEDFVTQAVAMHAAVDPSYSMRSYSAMSRIEKKFKQGFRAALGGRLEKLYVTASVHNGEFLLAEAPLYFRWTTANNLLNPTEGWTIEYTMTPSVNLNAPKGYYLSQALTQNYYYAVDPDQIWSSPKNSRSAPSSTNRLTRCRSLSAFSAALKMTCAVIGSRRSAPSSTIGSPLEGVPRSTTRSKRASASPKASGSSPSSISGKCIRPSFQNLMANGSNRSGLDCATSPSSALCASTSAFR